MFNQHYFSGHPLGNPILGSFQTITPLTQKELTDYFRTYYLCPSRIVVSVAGKLDHDAVIGKLAGTLGSIESYGEQRALSTPQPFAATHVFSKDLEQVHLCMGTRGISQTSPERFAAYLLNVLLGGSMSSRLFQEVREKRGLAYAVFSYLSSYFDTGILGVYVGTTPDKVNQVIELVIKELRKFQRNSFGRQ